LPMPSMMLSAQDCSNFPWPQIESKRLWGECSLAQTTNTHFTTLSLGPAQNRSKRTWRHTRSDSPGCWPPRATLPWRRSSGGVALRDSISSRGHRAKPRALAGCFRFVENPVELVVEPSNQRTTDKAINKTPDEADDCTQVGYVIPRIENLQRGHFRPLSEPKEPEGRDEKTHPPYNAACHPKSPNS